MAPIGEKSSRLNSTVDNQSNQDDSENLWATILSEVQSSSAAKLPSSKNIIILGDNESGKTTLIAKLQGAEDPKKGSGLEYYYINIKDDYRDDQTWLGVWILDGDPTHSGLLKYALTEQNFEHTLAVIVASMAQPWSVLESLQKWCTILRDHVDNLNISRERMREYEQSLIRFFQEYVEPEEGTAIQPLRRELNPLHPATQNTDDDKVLLPLGDTTLTQNLGIPLVIVLTKTDAIATLEKEQEYREEHFDFIQQHIRKYCLSLGTSLFYTSVKEDKNCDLLFRYLLHRIYGLPFSSAAYVVERDCVFVPTGWDNEKKISILYDNLHSMKPDEMYEDIISKPVIRKTVHKDAAETLVEDEQVFLQKQQRALSQTPTAGPMGDTPVRSPAQKPSSTTPRATTQPGTMTGGSPKKLDNAKAGTTSEGVLANFFNSLLSKGKAGSPPAGGGGVSGPSPGSSPAQRTDRGSVSRDAAAELERMGRVKKATAETTHTNDTGGS